MPKNDNPIVSLFKFCDMFGKPITFTLDDEEQFKTCEGGCCTITFMAGIAISALFNFAKLMTLPYFWRFEVYQEPARFNETMYPHNYGYFEALRVQDIWPENESHDDHQDPFMRLQEERKFGHFEFEIVTDEPKISA